MTTDSPAAAHPARPATPRMFGQRDYVLPDHVHTNLPRQGYHNEPAGWHHGRGLLVELCHALDATPVALYHRPLETPTGNPDGVVVTAIAQDSHQHMVTVVWRQQHHPLHAGQRRGWQLTVNGVTPPDGTGRLRPSPPLLARIAASAADR